MDIVVKTRQAALSQLHIESYVALANALKNILDTADSLPREIAIRCVLDMLRFFNTLLAYGLPELTYPLLDTYIFEVIKKSFQTWFRDVHKIRDVKEYVRIAQHFAMFARNFIAAGSQAENEFEQKMVQKVSGESTKDTEYRETLANHLTTAP